MKQSLQLSIILITIILITVMPIYGQGSSQALDSDVIQSQSVSAQVDISEKDHNTEALQLATQTIEGDSLKISVWDNLQMQIWKWQNDNWVNQIFGTNNKGFKLFFNENNMASYFYGNEPTPVSNTMPDDYTIETVVSNDNVEITQTVNYRNGHNYYTIRWEIWNRTGSEIDSLKFFAGEDTYFAGSDNGRGYWDNNNNMVYVKNTQGGETGIMGFYGAVSSPAITYYEGYYSMVRTAVTTGILPNTVNPEDHDAAYALSWRYTNLAPNNVWTISARETFQNVAVDEEAPTVTVLQPNGGETLSVGATMYVNWTASDNNEVTKIDIRLSTDGGNTYAIVNNDLPNTPLYSWTIPAEYVSDNCKIKVIAYDAAFNSAEDESDAVFSIISKTPSVSTISAEFGPPSQANVWEKYTIPLTASSFGVDETTFQQILANVSMFRIRTEMHDGSDVGCLDEVRIGDKFYSSFDTGPEEWNGAGDGTMEWKPTGGFSGGYLQISDWAADDWHWAVAPFEWGVYWGALIGSNIEFYYKTDHPSYGAIVEITSEETYRLFFEGDAPIIPKCRGQLYNAWIMICVTPTNTDWLDITLTSSNPSCIIEPDNQIIEPGDPSWGANCIGFSIRAAESAEIGCNSVITASAPGYGESRITLTVAEITVDFSGSPISGYAPLTVQFTDLSSIKYQPGSASAKDYFSNENSARLTNAEGHYWYMSDIDNAGGNITVKNNINRGAPAGLKNLTNKHKSNLSGLINADEVSPIKSWQWNFDNNATIDATDQNPSHTYTTAGTYTVSLTIFVGNHGFSETKVDYITVLPSEDTTPPGSVTNLTAEVVGSNSISLSWTNPTDEDYASTIIMRKIGSYPENVSDGVKVYDGTGTSYLDTDLTPGNTYYYTAFAYDNSNLYSAIAPNSKAYATISESDRATLSGYVTDATTGNGIGGATVTVAGISTTTDELGNYTIQNIPAGEVTANFSGTPRSGHAPLTVQFTDLSGAGYQPLTASAERYFSYETSILLTSGEVTNFDISLSPTITEGELRLVINWGSTPEDLDIHLKTPEIEGYSYEVWYNDKGSSDSPPYAVLDHDDTDSFGPETITIYRFFSGTYKCFVHNYSESPLITTSNAVVQVYGQSGLIETIYVPTTGEGLYWYVCDIDGTTGNVSVKNTIQNDSPEGARLRNVNLKKCQSSSVENISTVAPIESWQWDFDNDGTIDATTQHPSHTYTTAGTYTVKLTVSDGTSSYSETKVNYITVLSEVVPTKADFTVTFSSIDISAFPEVKSFVSIIDTLTHGPVQGLSADYVSVMENAVSVSPITVAEISSSSEAKADIVFVFDVTGSMGEEIEGLKERSLRFADSLTAQGIDYRLGLVTYSDEVEEVHDFTDANEFKAWIDGLTASGGGDEKENALEALARAAVLSFRATTQKIIVLITDADYHEAGETGDGTTIYTTETMISTLKEKAIVTNVVGPNLSQFQRLAEQTGGLHYDINGDFQTIIDNIGNVISSQYVISYTSRNPIADNTTRTVAVTVEKDERGGYGIGSYIIGTSRLVMSPATTIGIVNTMFTIELKVESIVNLGLCHFMVTFDPSTIEAVEALKGDFLEQGGASSTFLPEMDNSTGTIEISATRVGTTDGANGSGMIGTIKFKVLNENCTSDISFSTVDLRKPNNDAIPVSIQGTHIESASVTGLLGDFDNDLDIDTRDFALLSTYWKPINNAIGDIGPASGTPPMLTPTMDAQVNFEDLFVFTRMWNWYHDTHRSTEGGLLMKSMANLEWQVFHDKKDEKIIRIQLWANDVEQLAMAHLVIHYNSNALTYQLAQAGTLVTEGETTVAFLADNNQKKGIIDIALARLPSREQSPEVSGNGVLTTLEFERSNESNNPVISLHTVDLRTANNVQIAVSGTLEHNLGGASVPTSYTLEQNYPNPFNNCTQIIFRIPQALNVKIEIMNILGQSVKTLVHDRFDAGTHHISWDGKDNTDKEVMSGIYIMRMEAGAFRQTREMVYIK
jgi:PKD repeat protein